MNDSFLGFETCMAWMRNRDPMTQEEGFYSLLPHADKYTQELIDEYVKEKDERLQSWLIELICSGKSPAAFDFFAQQIRCDDQRLRTLAMHGLKDLGTKEANALLWQARTFTFGSREETEAFRSELRDVLNKRNLKI
jgi:hypothetical protein